MSPRRAEWSPYCLRTGVDHELYSRMCPVCNAVRPDSPRQGNQDNAVDLTTIDYSQPAVFIVGHCAQSGWCITVFGQPNSFMAPHMHSSQTCPSASKTPLWVSANGGMSTFDYPLTSTLLATYTAPSSSQTHDSARQGDSNNSNLRSLSRQTEGARQQSVARRSGTLGSVSQPKAFKGSVTFHHRSVDIYEDSNGEEESREEGPLDQGRTCTISCFLRLLFSDRC